MSSYDIQNKLGGMNKQQLLAYIQDKGNARKNAMHQITKLQTNDWHSTSNSKKSMVNEVNRLRQENREWQNSQEQKLRESAAEEQSIVTIEQNLRDKEAQLAKEKDSGNQSAAFKAQMKTHVGRVSAESIKKINKIFEDGNPEELSKMLEVFVALLRNNANSKPVDVELFFRDYAKLVSKMSKHDSTYCSLTLVEASYEKL